jgi:hypothetical protein
MGCPCKNKNKQEIKPVQDGNNGQSSTVETGSTSTTEDKK